MRKTMNFSIRGIKTSLDNVKIINISSLVTPENRISDMICKLNTPRSFRINKQRNFVNIIKMSPSCAFATEMGSKRLERSFMG